MCEEADMLGGRALRAMGGLYPALPTKPAFRPWTGSRCVGSEGNRVALCTHNNHASILKVSVIPQQVTSDLGFSLCYQEKRQPSWVHGCLV